MKRNIVIIFIVLFCSIRVAAQEKNTNWGIKFSGFVKTDIFYDTRQSSASNGIREGHFYLFPDDVLPDINGNDLNANPRFHILSIQTRLKGNITGPDAFGAKTSGAIEAEFFGTSESDLNGFRLRHAFVKMDWTNTSLLIGQTWHPMFPSESFPGTISFNTGAPFIPFSRNPQVRVTQNINSLSVSLTAYSQRDFSSAGPIGGCNLYFRNSAIPAMDLQARMPMGELITGWAGVNFKRLRPEIQTSTNYEADTYISGISTYANLKITTSKLNISLMGIYAQNACDLVMIGGYAVSAVDAVTQVKTYTPLNTGSVWADLSTKGGKVVYGIFTGFTKNLGASDIITGQVFGRGNNIDHIYRISPRATLTEGKLSFAAEVEITTAAYGTRQDDGKVTNTNSVSNLRLLLSAIYKF